MIIFKSDQVPLILNGTKTQIRRRWSRRWVKIGSIHQCKVTKKDIKPFAYVKILDVRQQRLGEMTEKDARKEGYESVEEYKKAIIETYGYWFYSLKVLVIDFEVVEKRE